MTLTPAIFRQDKKCGGSYIPDNKKCRQTTLGAATGRPCGQSHIAASKTCQKKGAFPKRAAIAAGLTAGAVGLGVYAYSRRRSRIVPVNIKVVPPSPASGSSGPSAPPSLPGDRTTRRLTGITPRGLLPPAPSRKSKTQRMRENTATAVRNAEAAIGRTAREEVRRIGQIGNAMITTGEAAGMATKTTLRELRLRTEAARRRFEPGYRSAPAAKPKPPAMLPEGGGLPVTRGRSPFQSPSTVEEWGELASQGPEALRKALTDPRTGQPRRRQARGFGRTDNYIPLYAPIILNKVR